MKIVLYACFFFLLQPLSGEPEKKKRYQPYLRYSYFSGFKDYEIEGVDSNGPWRSKLTFPVNNMRLDCGLSLVNDSCTFTFGLWSTLDRDSGTMTDNDWSNDVRDIWSRSDSDLTAFGVNTDITFWTVDTDEFSIGPKLGINFTYYDYDIYDVKQWGQEVTVDGKVLTYERGEVVLYPGFDARWRPFSPLNTGFDLCITPVSYIWDEDDHILRSKLSEAQAMSWYFSAGLKADYSLWESEGTWGRIGVHGRYSYMTSWYGSQDQKFYSGSNKGVRYSNITYSTTSEEFLVGVKLSMGF